MRFNANDIRGATFSRRLRGADQGELQAFLAGVADQVEQLERELNASQSRTLQLERELERYRSLDQGLRDTLLEVKTTSEGARETARREAELIVREAEFKAEQLLARGRGEERALKGELQTLRERRDSFVRRIRSLLEQQLELLELLATSEPPAANQAPVVGESAEPVQEQMELAATPLDMKREDFRAGHPTDA